PVARLWVLPSRSEAVSCSREPDSFPTRRSSDLATALGPVRSVRVWQSRHPIAAATLLPYSVKKLREPRGGGASSVMKSLNCSTPSPSPLSEGTGQTASPAAGCFPRPPGLRTVTL